MRRSYPGRYTGHAWAGRRIGILGGSFNPAHQGHRQISLIALAALGLDQIWWMVSPQNPLKSPDGMAAFDLRMASAEAVARHPRILVTDLERRLGTRYTADMLTALGRYYPKTQFVWLMGADNLGQIHRWQRWRSIFETVPVAVFDRPPYRLKTLAAPAPASYRKGRVAQERSHSLVTKAPPAWIFFTSRLEPLSSTEIRRSAENRSFPTKAGLKVFPDYSIQPNMVSESYEVEPPSHIRREKLSKLLLSGFGALTFKEIT